ncbi:LOW QUALITY PROTEIN: hypothetical protein PHMEG_00032384 [Phytophthora megakarya]|uniref:Uncharacterized protein n=1 Tax=Phytophthora megakarya TaxID=4795 RepID=A0A225UY98_9STRA|nr:LOW QUALITY PROTEIN: hypothetical protein PHMEG_00032384 [Phytophthora megakarya]
MSVITSKRDPELADRLTLLRLADAWRKFSVRENEPRVGNVDLRSGRNSDRKFRPAPQQRQPGPRYARSKCMIQVPSQTEFQDRTDPIRKGTCDGFFSPQQKRS